MTNFLETIKPGIPKRYLLFLAALAWTCAGGILLFKGVSIIVRFRYFNWTVIAISIFAGINFYLFLFSKISLKHANRIIRLKIKLPCMFSFFNFWSYLIMAVMITSGILLRRSGLISPQDLSVVYITMGIPLFLSAIRFYYYGIFYHSHSCG